MEYIIAFIIFIVIVMVIGVIFSYLWPLICALIIIAAIANLIAYHKRKKAIQDFYKDVETFQRDNYGKGSANSNDEIIDVEFTETDINDER